MRPNKNTTALRAALECTIPEMKSAATKAIEDAIKGHETLADAARSLHIDDQALRRLRRLIVQDPTAGKRLKTLTAPRK